MAKGENFILMQSDGLDCYGQISFDGTGTNHSPNLTAEKIVDFDTELSSDGVTADHSTNDLTINNPGTYDIYIHIFADVQDAETYTIYIAKNDVELGSHDIEIERKAGSLEIIARSFVTGLVADDALSFYVASTNAGGADFTPTFLRLMVNKIGT